MKSTLKRTSYYLVLGFLPLASNFLLAPLFTRYLSPAEYGIISLATLFQNYLTLFIDFGLKSSFSRYYYRYFKKPRIIHALFSTIVLAIFGTFMILSAFFLVFGASIFSVAFKNKLFTFDTYGSWVLVLTFNAILNAVILTYFRNAENIRKYAIISLSTFFLMAAGAVVGVILLQQGALGNILGKVVGSGIVVSVFFVLYFFRRGIRFEPRLFKPLLAYGLPFIPFGLLNATLHNLDRFFIDRYFDIATLGQYNIAFLISTIPFVMLNSFQSSINPGIMKLLETSNNENRLENYLEVNRNFKVMLLFMGTMLWGMITFSGLFTRFYVGPEYRDIINYLPILILAFIPLIYQNIFTLILSFHYQSKVLPVLSLVTLVGSAFLYFFLIKAFGIYGVALAVLGKNILFATSTFYIVRKKGYYDSRLFNMGKYNWLVFLLATSAVLALASVHVFPEKYYIGTLLGGGITGLIIMMIFRRELVVLSTYMKSIVQHRFKKSS